jgi:hypothetical protein
VGRDDGLGGISCSGLAFIVYKEAGLDKKDLSRVNRMTGATAGKDDRREKLGLSITSSPEADLFA